MSDEVITFLRSQDDDALLAYLNSLTAIYEDVIAEFARRGIALYDATETEADEWRTAINGPARDGES